MKFDEVIADLRAKGELDEGKLKRFKGTFRNRVIFIIILCTSLTVLFIGEGRSFLFILIIVVAHMYILKTIKKNTERFAILYCIGKKTESEATYCARYRRAFYVKYRFNLNDSSYEQQNKRQGFEISDVSSEFERRLPNIGEKITILYLLNDPAINCVFLEKMSDRYNFKMEK